MRAVQYHEYGDPSVLSLVEIDRPEAGPGQVQVEVTAVSLNPFDAKLRAGSMRESIPLHLPITIGGDLAGVVSAVGEGTTGFQPGDHVYGQAAAVAGASGSFADYAVTKAGQLALAPNTIDLVTAAALPLVGVSAWQAITQHLAVQTGQRVLVLGGGGGIGSLAIQLAKHLGATVAATATGADLGYVRQLGADEVIDYRATDFRDTIKDYDAVFDTAGANFNDALEVLHHGGRAVSMIARADEHKAADLGVTALTQGTQVTTAALDALRGLVELSVLTVRIDSTLPLDQAAAAFARYESGAAKGKIVLKLK